MGVEGTLGCCRGPGTKANMPTLGSPGEETRASESEVWLPILDRSQRRERDEVVPCWAHTRHDADPCKGSRAAT